MAMEQYREGDTATNPKTGQRYIYKNGSWEDLPEMTVGKMLTGAAINAPSSAVQFGRDVVEPFLSPVETAKSAFNLGKSVLGKAGIIDADPELANQVGQHFVNRYGSVDNAMRTFSTDPVGMASDVAGLLTAGGALAAKAAAKALAFSFSSSLTLLLCRAICSSSAAETYSAGT